MSKYVLKEFEIDPAKTTFLRISCRPSGVFSWILNMVGITPKSSLIVNRHCLDYRSSSLSGFTSVSAPLNQINTVQCGLKKNFWNLVFAGVCFFLGTLGVLVAGPVALLFLIVSIWLGISYFLKKNFYIGFRAGGDPLYFVQFYASLIEGIKVDQEKVEQASSLIRSAILQNKQQ